MKIIRNKYTGTGMMLCNFCGWGNDDGWFYTISHVSKHGKRKEEKDFYLCEHCLRRLKKVLARHSEKGPKMSKIYARNQIPCAKCKSRFVMMVLIGKKAYCEKCAKVKGKKTKK